MPRRGPGARGVGETVLSRRAGSYGQVGVRQPSVRSASPDAPPHSGHGGAGSPPPRKRKLKIGTALVRLNSPVPFGSQAALHGGSSPPRKRKLSRKIPSVVSMAPRRTPLLVFFLNNGFYGEQGAGERWRAISMCGAPSSYDLVAGKICRPCRRCLPLLFRADKADKADNVLRLASCPNHRPATSCFLRSLTSSNLATLRADARSVAVGN